MGDKIVKNVELHDYSKPDSIPLTDSLYRESRDKAGPWAPCQASKTQTNPGRGLLTDTEAITQMEKFFDNYYGDTENSHPERTKWDRIGEVRTLMKVDGNYEHTFDELSWAAKTAWRNAPRCAGRNLWKTLHVVDERAALHCKEIFDAICKNLRLAFNGGLVEPSAVIFRQRFRGSCQNKLGIRVWNGTVLSFAGFLKENGDIVGDPKNVDLTNLAKSFGWTPKVGKFVLLPLMITDAYEHIEIFELPEDIKGYIVDISHPTEPDITNLGLKWYAIPSVSSMMLEAGGVQYTCTQIAGFFQDTEVSVLNLLAESRYNLMESIGRKLNLDVSANTTYWKCKVALELTKAVYHSFVKARVSMVDHITMAENFSCFMKEEVRKRGGCPADWIWVVPPMSSGLTRVFHQEMLRYTLSPSYEYQPGPQAYFKRRPRKVTFHALTRTVMYFLDMMRKSIMLRKRVTIVYATEGNTAFNFAKMAEKLFIKVFNVSVLPISALTKKEDIQKIIDSSEVCFFIVSTFGNGGPPSMAKKFHHGLIDKAYHFGCMKYAVFALGSSKYKNTFADFGKFIDSQVEQGGGARYQELGFGDDQTNQKLAFEKWIKELFEKCCADFLPPGQNFCGQSTERNTLYRWRYSDKKSIHECFQDAQGDAHDVFEFTLDKKICLSKSKSKYYLVTLSFDPKNKTPLLFPGQHLAIYPRNISSAKKDIARKLLDVPFCGIPLRLQEKIAVHEPWRESNSNYSGLTLGEWTEYVVDLSRAASILEDKMCDSAHFFGQMPKIKRRLFSIASCPNVRNEIKILISMHEFELNGKTVPGLTSNFMRHASLGDKIQGYFSRTDDEMQPASDPETPLLVISAGSGFAPFLSFIEEREQAARSGKKTGPVYIFHGCRFEEWDFLDQLLDSASAVLQITTFRAHSRPSGGTINAGFVMKGYVQDILAAHEEVVARVCREGGYMYACGGTNMVHAVRKKLEMILENQNCGTFQEIIESKRYQEEKFG